jgi:phosphoribosylaminoimidazolecarboxamide formyltransferase/IMP cyclohydrolase
MLPLFAQTKDPAMHVPSQSSTPDLVPIRRALLSVSDKTGIVDFASALQKEFNVELVSTGGTAKALRDAGLKVSDVSDLTGFPEMMDGRVKTLHPKVHGGFLALRDNPEHLAAMQTHGIVPIDLVCVNLYPFEQTIAKPNCSFAEAIENIDIGGPAMIRSASKNHRSIVVVTDPIQYEKVLKHMRRNKTPEGLGQTPYKFRLDLAMWAYSKTAQYDAAIYPYLGQHYFKDNPEKIPEQAGLAPLLTPRLQRKEVLRYGENPHQLGAFYTSLDSKESGIATATQLHGKALSYINILDADAAIELVREFQQPAAAVIKHTNPCGCAIGSTLAEAFDKAYAGDPVAAFGGIVALNREVDERTAEEIVSGKRFLEVIIAPGYSAPALEMLKDRWKDCRILATGSLDAPRDAKGGGQLHYRSVTGGVLVQQRDLAGFDRNTCTVTSIRKPTEEQWTDLAFIWLATKHVKSNAIALANNGQLLAAGAGQMSRPMSAKIAIELAQKNGHADSLRGSAAGSDAFFPFPDAPELLINAGITAIIHPGGSKKDQDTIDLCNRHNIALVTTGQRHFAH